LQNPRVIYGILFRAASESLLELAADPKRLGARLGFLAVLHTWTQRLECHPPVHCVVPADGLSADGKRWISSRKKFFLPVDPLSCLFRQVSGLSRTGVHPGSPGVLRTPSRTGSPGPLSRFSIVPAPEEMGGLRQTPFRRTGAGPAVSGAIHPSSSDFQWATVEPRGWPRALPMARFAGPQSDQTDVPGCRGVHPPLPPAHSARRLCEDPAFRLSFQPPSQGHGSTLPGTPATLGRNASHDQAPRTSLPSLQNRPPPCDRMAASTAVALKHRIALPNTSVRLFLKTDGRYGPGLSPNAAHDL
jgi:hypothetical protein